MTTAKRYITKTVIRGWLRNWLVKRTTKKTTRIYRFDMETVRIINGSMQYWKQDYSDDFTFYIDNIMRKFLIENKNRYLVANKKNLKKLEISLKEIIDNVFK